MADRTDHELLAEYAHGASEAAFTQLVARYVNLVYSTALRCTAGAPAAEDITQAVFVILARKAATLSSRVVLSGWLYQTTRHTAANWLRSEMQRRRREQEAYMQTGVNEEANPAAWEQMAPLLDAAMGHLAETDRNAVVLRFFENRTAAEVAARLHLSESAAHKRVHRALDKLRKFFARHGVESTTTEIAGTIATHSLQVAPAALVQTVATVALTKGAAASASTLTLIQGALKIMAWTKAKTVIVVGLGALVATSATTVVVEKVRTPSVPESLWVAKLENIRRAPKVLIIRPTRYPESMSVGDGDYKCIANNIRLAGLIRFAYASNRGRTIFPAELPTNRFDLMLTLPDHPREALQKAIKRKFGFVAKHETRNTDVLFLKVKNPDALALHTSKRGGRADAKLSDEMWAVSNFPISNIVTDFLEGTFSKPIIVPAELNGNYNLAFQWKEAQGQEAKEQAVVAELGQAGLELVPGNELVEMLVVEKVE